MTRNIQKGAGLVGRQLNGAELKMLGVLAHDLLVHAAGARSRSGVWCGGIRPPAGKQTPSETEDGG
ncbi:hypothetical protein CLG94_02715 [Candidatus Methylomirabilis limnetica]|jgi:hypothetical protein|uniref:Uncharacterized protein n=1 Tax=Candidatus Methylomirabilis limnetica TaxID=2033718 RepID=A0A2T4TZR2_9BACT|nr:hypothetical protein CLG94_02715 [Candidatus Methylomirabilis limnetica]